MSKLLQIWKVAERLDCSKRYVYTLIELGRLRVVRLGKRGLRVTQESLDKLIIHENAD